MTRSKYAEKYEDSESSLNSIHFLTKTMKKHDFRKDALTFLKHFLGKRNAATSFFQRIDELIQKGVGGNIFWRRARGLGQGRAPCGLRAHRPKTLPLTLFE